MLLTRRLSPVISWITDGIATPEHTQGGEEDLLHESYPTSVGVAVTTSRSTGAPGIVTEPGTSRQPPPLTRYVAVYVVSTLGPTCPFFR